MALMKRVVDRVKEVEPSSWPSDPFRKVHLHTDGSYKVHQRDRRAAVWLGILEHLSRKQAPVYLEVDEDGVVHALFMPRAVRIGKRAPSPDGTGLDVELIISAAPHAVSRSNPGYQLIVAALQDAQERRVPVLVTETLLEGEIFDVRPAPPGAGPRLVEVSSDLFPRRLPDRGPLLSETKAQEVFDYLASQSDIPFNFLKDGCCARAHAMCHLLLQRNYLPSKIWNFTDFGRILLMFSPNMPLGLARWAWHVAPVLTVSLEKGGSDQRVIDPSLFQGPVPVHQWIDAQHDSKDIPATQAYTDWKVYWRDKDGQVMSEDDDFSTTEEDLEDLIQRRAQFFLEQGEPPYPCP